MATHTPGPWIVSALNGRDVGPVRAFTLDGTDVRQLQSVAVVRERAESEANARLIAAAPELLELLKEVVLTELPPRSNFNERARAAIAKAEGR